MAKLVKMAKSVQKLAKKDQTCLRLTKIEREAARMTSANCRQLHPAHLIQHLALRTSSFSRRQGYYLVYIQGAEKT